MVLCNSKDSKKLQSLKEWKTSLKDNNIFYLNVDNFLVYDGFFNDFGPLNLAMIHRFINIVKDKLKVSTIFISFNTFLVSSLHQTNSNHQ